MKYILYSQWNKWVVERGAIITTRGRFESSNRRRHLKRHWCILVEGFDDDTVIQIAAGCGGN